MAFFIFEMLIEADWEESIPVSTYLIKDFLVLNSFFFLADIIFSLDGEVFTVTCPEDACRIAMFVSISFSNLIFYFLMIIGGGVNFLEVSF